VRACTALKITVFLRDDLPPAVEGCSNGEGRIEINARAAVGNRAQTLIHEYVSWSRCFGALLLFKTRVTRASWRTYGYLPLATVIV